MSIKIAIIAHACRGGGGLFQTTNLLKAFKAVMQDERFLLVCSAGYGLENIELSPDSEIFIYPGKHNPLERCWFEQISLSKIIKRYNPDVIYSPGPQGLTNPSVPQALFIRNAYLFYDKKHYPDMYPWLSLRIAALKMQVKKSLPGTKLIFCQTPVVKQRFSKRYNYPLNQMKILGFPPPDEILPVPNSQKPEVFKKWDDAFCILMLTCFMPHKNPGILIPLCKKYSRQLRDKKIRFITTVEKDDHPRAAAFLRQISRNNLDDIIINVGELSRQDVSAYMSFSDVFWLPTLLECLSTSHLEALAVGIPIMAPDLDFARYICDDAAVYYNPWDVNSVFEKIMLLRQNQKLREELVKKARLQLQNNDKFPQNWNEVAAITLQELRKLAQIK